MTACYAMNLRNVILVISRRKCSTQMTLCYMLSHYTLTSIVAWFRWCASCCE